MIPVLQVALDITDVQEAEAVTQRIYHEADIVEAGTILVLEEGLDSVRALARIIEKQAKLLADVRIVKAGGKIASMVYEAGADIVTIISDATKETFESVVKAKESYTDKEIMIEINDTYTDEALAYWKSLNISYLIFHRGSELTSAALPWQKEEIEEINRLAQLGFKVFVTGGLTLDELATFKGSQVYGFIIGRSITKASDPAEAVKQYKETIHSLFK